MIRDPEAILILLPWEFSALLVQPVPRSSRSFPPPLSVLAAGAPAEPSRETLSDSREKREGGGGEEGATEGGGRGAQPERGCWRLHLLEGGFSAAW